MRWQLMILSRRLFLPLFAVLCILTPFGPEARGTDKILSVPELIKDYKVFEGKVVTVRGIYSGEATAGYMIPEMNAKRYGDTNIVGVTLDRARFHRLFGRLERSLIVVRGKIAYDWMCDERVPYEHKVPETDEYVIVNFHCSMFSGVSIEASSLKVVDTYAADDPRIGGWLRDEWVALPMPKTDPQYPAISRLALAWRQAIIDRDVDRLKQLSRGVKEDFVFRPPDRFYNIAFRGADSLRNRMRRNRIGPIHILHRLWDDPPAYDVNQPNYYYVEICYCLKRTCGMAEITSLRNVVESNLKDPLWCFTTDLDDGRWTVDLNTRPRTISDGVTNPDADDG